MIILEALRLIEEGELSYRAIAARLHISHGSVQNILAGRCENRRDGPRANFHGLDAPAALAVRCPGCGGLVYQPCRLCQARAYHERRRQMRRLAQSARSTCRLPRRVA